MGNFRRVSLLSSPRVELSHSSSAEFSMSTIKIWFNWSTQIMRSIFQNMAKFCGVKYKNQLTLAQQYPWLRSFFSLPVLCKINKYKWSTSFPPPSESKLKSLVLCPSEYPFQNKNIVD